MSRDFIFIVLLRQIIYPSQFPSNLSIDDWTAATETKLRHSYQTLLVMINKLDLINH